MAMQHHIPSGDQRYYTWECTRNGQPDEPQNILAKVDTPPEEVRALFAEQLRIFRVVGIQYELVGEPVMCAEGENPNLPALLEMDRCVEAWEKEQERINAERKAKGPKAGTGRDS